MSRRVAVIGAGGTISMEGAHRYDWIDYGDTGIIHDTLSVLQSLDLSIPGVELVPIPFKALGSTGISVTDWQALADIIDQAAAESRGIDGIVVLHGTASLEETAFFLHLVHRSSPTVVITGAQRPPNTVGSDAAPNLRAAVFASLIPQAGVLVAMDGYLFAAPDVSKLANHALDAFASPEFGPVGRIELDGTIGRFRLPANQAAGAFQLALRAETFPRVDIAFSHVGADGTAIAAFVTAGAKAIISTGFPPGRSTPGERAALLDAVKAGVLVVQSSRAIRGRVPLQRYNTEVGILSGGGLSPNKARVLVMLALACGQGPAQIQDLLMLF